MKQKKVEKMVKEKLNFLELENDQNFKIDKEKFIKKVVKIISKKGIIDDELVTLAIAHELLCN